MLLGGTGSREGCTGQYMMVLGQYRSVLVDTFDTVDTVDTVESVYTVYTIQTTLLLKK